MRVYGGLTGAGTKKPLVQKREPWTCPQGHENKSYWVRCFTPGCIEKRP